MPIEFSLSDEPFNTQYAPLGVLLALYQQKQVLQPLEQVVAPEKKVLFSTHDKLKQVLVSILAGCDTLSEVNTKLQGDQPLAQAGGWVAFADQSTLSLTLDALTLMNLTQLQHCLRQLLRLHGDTGSHDWRGFLWLDYDLSGLPCSKRSEGSQKGYFSQKNSTGRQLARVSAAQHQETIWSGLFPGNAHTVNCFPTALQSAQDSLELDSKQRQRTVWRFDGGGGSEANFRLLLAQGYHRHAKGLSSSRAAALAKQATRWDAYHDKWVAEVPPPFDLGRPVRVFVQRRLHQGQFLHNYFVSTLTFPAKSHFLSYYDARGGAEVAQFREDKSGLALAIRRKRAFAGQLAYILLTDLAHNLVADFKHHGLSGSPFAHYGIKRIIRDLFCLPGSLLFADQQLVRVTLPTLKQNSHDLLFCLEKYCSERFS